MRMWPPRNQPQSAPPTPPTNSHASGHVYASLDSFHSAPSVAADTPPPVRARAGRGVLGTGSGVFQDLRVRAKSLRRRRQFPASLSATLSPSFKPFSTSSSIPDSSSAWEVHSSMPCTTSPAAILHQPLQQLARLYKEALLPLGNRVSYR